MFVLKIFFEIFKEGSKLLFQMLISCSCEVQDISTSVNNVITMNLSICLLWNNLCSLDCFELTEVPLNVLQKTLFFINLFFSYPSLSILKRNIFMLKSNIFNNTYFNSKSFDNNFHCNQQESSLAECTSQSMLDRSMPLLKL